MTNNYDKVLQRELLSLSIDCDILKYTYTFDGRLAKVFDQGVQVSEWTVEQLAKRQVYV